MRAEKAPIHEFAAEPKVGIHRAPGAITWVLPEGAFVSGPRGSSRGKAADSLKMFPIHSKPGIPNCGILGTVKSAQEKASALCMTLRAKIAFVFPD